MAISPHLFLQAMGHELKALTLKFSISNLQYSTDVRKGSATFNSTERVLQCSPAVLDETLVPAAPGPVEDGAATSVEAVCTYHPDPMARDGEYDRDTR
nr:mucin-16 [Equus caballus]